MKLSRKRVREVLVQNGFKCHEQENGILDLKPYVYIAIDKLLREVGSGITYDRPKCCAIVAYDHVTRYIGDDNKLPWKLKEDMARFKALTHGKAVVMGRNTCESLGCKPLPGRTNIVVTRDTSFCPSGFIAFNALENALSFAESVAANNGKDEYFVIGGAQIYEQAIDSIDRIYATEVESGLSGHCTFPSINPDWWTASEPWHIALESLPYCFITYDRKKAV